MKKKFSYEEIKTLVNAFDENEFSLLKDAVNERNIEEYGTEIGEIDPNNKVVDSEEVIIDGHRFLYGQKQIDEIRKDKKVKSKSYRPFID